MPSETQNQSLFLPFSHVDEPTTQALIKAAGAARVSILSDCLGFSALSTDNKHESEDCGAIALATIAKVQQAVLLDTLLHALA
jgi:hypothetical protein